MQKEELCQGNHPHNERIREVKAVMPDEDDLYEVAELFKVFGDSTRTRILSALFYHELCVCDICKVVGMNKSAVSHQLKVLKNFNLVKGRREGKEVFYSLADEHVVLIYKMALEHVLEKKEG